MQYRLKVYLDDNIVELDNLTRELMPIPNSTKCKEKIIRYYNFNSSLIVGRNKFNRLVFVRSMLCYFLRKLNYGYLDIGIFFNFEKSAASYCDKQFIKKLTTLSDSHLSIINNLELKFNEICK